MQKHRSRAQRRRSEFVNDNFRLDASAEQTVYGIIDSIDGRENVALTYLRAEYLSKYCDESATPATERKQNAIAKFRACEVSNRETNIRIMSLDPGYNILPRVSFSRFRRFARRLIRDVLGPLRDEVVLGSFSGGASTSRLRLESHPALKFVGKAHCTEEAAKYIRVLHENAPLLREYGSFADITIVEGNVLFTVPKKTDIDRCACKEPDVNMFLQKGVGNHIRRRLLKFGIDLNDQSKNRSLAHLGSVNNTLATIDLSSASDLISREVVRTLLPRDWYDYLNDIRSKHTIIEGETTDLEMFSSMGNGFTFELESLIFFVLCRTTAYFEGIPGIISIMGDDIIVPSSLYDQVSWVLREFGFVLNPKKSFHNGPFRESCGGHYNLGEDITPFYLKRKATRLTDLIRVANQLRRWALADAFRQYELPELYQTWYRLAQLVPRKLWGGYDYGVDTQLVTPPTPAAKYKLVRFGRKKSIPPVGSYLHWHNTNWNRSDEIEGSIFEPEDMHKQKCRLRRTTKGAPVCEKWFHQELF